MRTAGARFYSIVCLAKAHRCRGCKPHPATLAPAGSARGGSGGDEWSEALREKVPSGDQRAIRAAAQANTNEASKGSNVRADPPVERAGRRRQASERDTPLDGLTGVKVAARMAERRCATRE